MVRKYMSKVHISIKHLYYFALNIYATRGMPPMPDTEYGEYWFSGLKQNQIPLLDRMHKSLRNGRPLYTWKKHLLKYRGRVLCGVLMDRNERLLGFQMHYFRKDEVSQKILYVDYSGLDPEVRGKGFAAALRNHTAGYFADQGLKGLSSVTSVKKLDKPNFLALVEKVGYQIIHKPPDPDGLASLYLDLSKYKV